jgi:hypothetical protein
MKNLILEGFKDYQMAFLRDYLGFVEELRGYVLEQAGSMDADTLHGLTTRIEALRNDLADGLPPDPRALAPARGPLRFPPPPGGPAGS